MGRARLNTGAARSFPAELVAVALLCSLCAGCNNSCVGFFSNPSGGTLSINVDTCTTKDQDNGNVRLRFSAPSDSAETWHKAGIQHVFLTLREIDARLKPDSGEGSFEWYDLAPKLKHQPLQIDLLAKPDAAASPYFDGAALPAGAYTQIRIFLLSDQPETGASVLSENGCATASLNCVLTRDGNIHSLRLRAEPILIDADQPTDAVLYVVSRATSNLDLEFIPGASKIYTLGQAAWFDPRLSARWTFSSASTDPANEVLPQ